MSDLLAALDALRERLTEIPQADERRLQELKTEILGRKAGALTRILGALPSLEPKERKTRAFDCSPHMGGAMGIAQPLAENDALPAMGLSGESQQTAEHQHARGFAQ